LRQKNALDQPDAYNLQSENNPLWRELLNKIWRNLLISGIFRLSADLCDVIAPFLLRYFLSAIKEARQDDSAEGAANARRATHFAVVIGCILIFQTLSTNHSHWKGSEVGLQARSFLIGCLFQKTLRPPELVPEQMGDGFNVCTSAF
jgi:hypothetical protein